MVVVAGSVPPLSVLGVAGPGNAVDDWRHANETAGRVQTAIPDQRLCVSINGLALATTSKPSLSRASITRPAPSTSSIPRCAHSLVDLL